MRILEARQTETQNFKEASRRWPRLFETKTFVDDRKFLDKYGIFPPEKRLPFGYLKLWPQDFIVEEISLNKELQTVFPERFINREREFLYQDPVIYATLVKCGLSTIEAAEELSKGLNMWPKDIKFAGIKDKHAITAQLISIKKINIEKIHQLSHSYFFLKNIFSGKRELYLGSLIGNQFTILIRTDQFLPEKQFGEKLKKIEREGFYNFFYLQRFGVPRLINAYSGLAVLKGDYEGAVFNAFCRPGERELLYFQGLRKEIEKSWGKWDEIEEILDLFPSTFQDERKMLDYLIKNPTDFIGALNQIPRVVELWLTCFAALLFNKLLSFYVKEGKEPPKNLPLVLSSDKTSWQTYEDLLKQTGIFSSTHALKNLKPFPFITLRKREQKTKEKVEILNYKILPVGVILNFNLSKGCYATTFLSHLFTLISGALPSKFSNLPIDTKANLGKGSLEEILNQFSDVVSSPAWRYLWRIY